MSVHTLPTKFAPAERLTRRRLERQQRSLEATERFAATGRQVSVLQVK